MFQRLNSLLVSGRVFLLVSILFEVLFPDVCFVDICSLVKREMMTASIRLQLELTFFTWDVGGIKTIGLFLDLLVSI